MATDYTKASDITTKNTIDVNDKIMAVNGTSNYNIDISAFKQMATDAAREVNTDNVFVVYHPLTSTRQYLAEPSKWQALQNSGERAEGVFLDCGDKHIIVSLHESSTGLKWGLEEKYYGGSNIRVANIAAAITDWSGAESFAEQIKDTNSKNDPTCAIGFCYAYGITNTNGVGYTAGRWRMGGVGEMKAIYANKGKINYVLSLIDGATQLANNTTYWANTEDGAGVWYVNFQTGLITTCRKIDNNKFRVRPVISIQ